MDIKDTGGGVGERSQGQAPNPLKKVIETFRQLPARSKRGLALVAMMAVVLVGYSLMLARQDEAGRSMSPSEQTSPGDGSEAVIIVEPGETGDDEAEEVAGDGASAADNQPPIPGSLLWPVSGEILTSYGWGYNQALEDWRFHSGIDLLPGDNEQVLAMEAGNVTALYLDPEWGWVAEIEHAPDFIARYAGFDKILVSAGDTVERGDVIGTVGESAALEAGLPPHLHLEMTWKGETVDPLTFLSSGS